MADVCCKYSPRDFKFVLLKLFNFSRRLNIEAQQHQFHIILICHNKDVTRYLLHGAKPTEA